MDLRKLLKRASSGGLLETPSSTTTLNPSERAAAVVKLRDDVDAHEALLVEVIEALSSVPSPPAEVALLPAPHREAAAAAPPTTRLLDAERRTRAFDAAISRRGAVLRAIQAELRTARGRAATVLGQPQLPAARTRTFASTRSAAAAAAAAAWTRAEAEGAAVQRAAALDELSATRSVTLLTAVESAWREERQRACAARTEAHEAQQRLDALKQRLWALESAMQRDAQRGEELRGQLGNREAQPDELKQVKVSLKATMAEKRVLEAAAEARRATIIEATSALERISAELETLRARRDELQAGSPRSKSPRRTLLQPTPGEAPTSTDITEKAAAAAAEEEEETEEEAVIVLRSTLERGAARLVAHAAQLEREREEGRAASASLQLEIEALHHENDVASAAIAMDVSLGEEARATVAALGAELTAARAAAAKDSFALESTLAEQSALEERGRDLATRAAALQKASDEQRPKTEALQAAEAASARTCAQLEEALVLLAHREAAVNAVLRAVPPLSAAAQAEAEDEDLQRQARAVGIRGPKSEWRRYMSSAPLPPDVDVDSPMLTQLLATWTKNRAQAETVRGWLRVACDPGAAVEGEGGTVDAPLPENSTAVPPDIAEHMPFGLELERIGVEVREGFLTFVYPLLRKRQLRWSDVEVEVSLREWQEERTDMRIKVVGRTHELKAPNGI